MPTWESLLSFAFLDRLIAIFDLTVWPITILIALLIFRVPLNKLLAQIKEAEFWGVRLDIDQARELEAEARLVEETEGGPKFDLSSVEKRNQLNSLLSAQGLRPLSSGFDTKYYFAIAKTDPKISLAAVRIDLEAIIENLFVFHGLLTGNKFSSTSVKVEILESSGWVTTSQASIYRGIMSLLNKTVHLEMPSSEVVHSVISAFGTILDDFAYWVDQHADQIADRQFVAL